MLRGDQVTLASQGTSGVGEPIDVFLSWAGARSKKIAEELKDWLPRVLPPVNPFLSADIQPGSRWGYARPITLETASFGIFCITKDNLRAPWLMYEAGAASKSLSPHSAFILFGCKQDDLEGPLVGAPVVLFTKAALRDLVLHLAERCKADKSEVLRLFSDEWRTLEQSIQDVFLIQLHASPTSKNNRLYVPPIYDVCRVNEEQIENCLKRDVLSPDSCLRLGYRALQLYLDERAKGEDNYLDFIFEALINRTTKEEPFIRQNHNDVVHVDAPNSAGAAWASRGYLVWRRSVNFQVKRLSNTDVPYPGEFGTTCACVDKDMVQMFLRDFEYRIVVDNTNLLFDWRSVVNEVDADALIKGERFESGGCIVQYDGTRLGVAVNKAVAVASISTITVSETSFIRDNENYYYLSMRHPTRRLTLTVTLGRGLDKWVMLEPNVGPRRYYPRRLAQPSVSSDPRHVSVYIPSWVLPGVVLVVEWSSTEAC